MLQAYFHVIHMSTRLLLPMATSYVGQKTHGVFADAKAKVGSTFNEPMETNQMGLSEAAADDSQFSSANDKPVPKAHSDVPRRTKPHRDDGRD
jgi:hypothetical protein